MGNSGADRQSGDFKKEIVQGQFQPMTAMCRRLWCVPVLFAFSVFLSLSSLFYVSFLGGGVINVSLRGYCVEGGWERERDRSKRSKNHE